MSLSASVIFYHQANQCVFIFTTERGKVMLSVMSVCLSVHKGGFPTQFSPPGHVRTCSLDHTSVGKQTAGFSLKSFLLQLILQLRFSSLIQSFFWKDALIFRNCDIRLSSFYEQWRIHERKHYVFLLLFISILLIKTWICSSEI